MGRSSCPLFLSWHLSPKKARRAPFAGALLLCYDWDVMDRDTLTVYERRGYYDNDTWYFDLLFRYSRQGSIEIVTHL